MCRLARVRLLLLCCVLVVGGCAGGPARDAAPVESRRPDRAAAPASAEPTLPATQATPPVAVPDAGEPPSADTGVVPAKERAGAAQSLLDAAASALARGEFDRAQAALERAVRLAPGDYEIWYRLARVHYHQGDFDQALQLARRALSLSPPLAVASATWRLIADSHAALGADDAARAARRRAVTP